MTDRFGDSLSRRSLLRVGGAALIAPALGSPALSQGQSDVIRIGHLTPRTGFLGPLGEFAVQAAQLAVEEINASGGIAGRKVELLSEDSVNPQTASAKAERMVQRDRVACLVGEINSASALAISQVAQREKVLFINTGANSDALRGADCKRGRPRARREGPDQGQEGLRAHRRLRLRPRPAEAGQEVLHRQRGDHRGRGPDPH